MVSADRISSLVLAPPALNTSQTGASRLPAAASVHRQLGSLVSRCRCAVCRAHRYPPRAPPNRAQSPSTAVWPRTTYPLTHVSTNLASCSGSLNLKLLTPVVKYGSPQPALPNA
eukprot:scaffold22585_cov72-Phaeocystis_antarctica.AAC.1